MPAEFNLRSLIKRRFDDWRTEIEERVGEAVERDRPALLKIASTGMPVMILLIGGRQDDNVHLREVHSEAIVVQWPGGSQSIIPFAAIGRLTYF